MNGVDIFFLMGLIALVAAFCWGVYHLIKGAVCVGFRPEIDWCASINHPEEPKERKKVVQSAPGRR
tara:strand:- start:42 stop:239 length:198 start_codon:yes stop_codon:yes gene_type:complete